MADVYSHSYRYWTIKKVKTKPGRTVKPIMSSKAQLPTCLAQKLKMNFKIVLQVASVHYLNCIT